MCHGHPKDHPCRHTSVNWYYCPTAVIDLDTGFETPCNNVSFAPPQPSSLDCPLSLCGFKDKGGVWFCCQCKQGPNHQGWCEMPSNIMSQSLGPTTFGQKRMATCDHGCCRNCESAAPSPPEMSYSDTRRSKEPVKRTYRRPNYSIITAAYAPTLDEGCFEGSLAPPSTCSSSPYSSSQDSYKGYTLDKSYRASKRTQRRSRLW